MTDPLTLSDFPALALFGGDSSYPQLGHRTFRQAVPNPKTGVDPCEVWCSQPVERLREYCNVIKLRIFSPLFREGASFLEDRGLPYEGWSIDTICEDCVLEDLADLFKKVVNIPHFISGILRIGRGIENGCFHLAEALHWVMCAGDAKLLKGLEQLGDVGRVKLGRVFAEWNCYITKMALGDRVVMEILEDLTCESARERSESMKQSGNAEFSQGALDCAIMYYTQAIDFWPMNHLLYGNRALCYILTRQYEKAVVDGKRAIIMKPDWPKGHHHFCKALFLLGRAKLALKANERALELCRDSPEGLKELLQQNEKFKKTLEERNGTKQKQKPRKPGLEKKDCTSSKSPLITSQEEKEGEKDRKRAQADPKYQHCPQKHEAKVTEAQRTEGKVSTLELPPNQSQQNKRKPKTKTCDYEKMRDPLDLKRDSKSMEDKDKGSCTVPQGDFGTLPDVKSLPLEGHAAIMDSDRPDLFDLLRALKAPEFTVDFNILPEEVKALARDGCRALQEQQCHNAERAFSVLLGSLYASGFPGANILNINYVILLYGHASALLGIGHPEALAKAEGQFKKIIEEYPEERCSCLAHYGIGRVYLRQNRFEHALDQFLRSKLMIDYRIVPGVLTWPGTAQVIEETRMENLQMALRNCIEECKFPPQPDAVCRYQHCHGYSKIQIYFTDPDFKGFIRTICCQQCRVEFHISCWKKLKTTSYSDKNDKDFLKEMCFTPDCKGLISKIVIFNSSRLIKCEFEQKIPKLKEPPRVSIKQKCSSLRKIKMKEEKKQRRKRAREEARNCARKKEEEKQGENEQSQYSQHRGYGQDLPAGDQVLQHLSRNSRQIQAALPDAAQLLKQLVSWGVLSEEESSRGSSSAQEVLEQLLGRLILEKSRVRTRALLHALSQLRHGDPRVLRWLKHLNNLGLTATKNFLHQYGQVLQELDLSILIPVWNQKYGNKFDYVAANAEKQEICDYFLKPPLEKTRCFIWLLEENREHFPGLHQALDEFFDKMDDPTIILKKQGNENISNNEIKVKNKNRKKNSKDSKSILVLSSGVSTAPREEEKIFIEENTSYRDLTNEPFVIPEYLQEQLEEFEALYNLSNSNNYQRRLNNNPDPVSENLYEYFSQILDEHGPLEMNNKLLIGEYEHFPEETRKVVEDQGGLEAFLLKSPQFIMVDNLIGLKKHSVLFEGNPSRNETENKQENDISEEFQGNSSRSKLQLNPYAEEFKPLSYPLDPHLSAPDLTDYATPQYLPCAFPASCSPANPLGNNSVRNESSLPGVFLKGFEPAGPVVFVPQSSWGYQYGILPSLSAGPVLAQPAYVYADPAAPRDNQESAIPRGKYIPGGIQEYKGLQGSVENSGKDNSAFPNGSGEAEKDKCVKKEMGRRGKAGRKSNPHTRMVAVQVNQEAADRETNTLPFHPFENHQGDILRMEKEHQVLKEQLKEAEEKFEQLQSRNLEEIETLEEFLKKCIEEAEVSQNELDWFHRDSESQMKKWQQEKKENRENLKALRSTVKKHSDTNERYLKTIDDKQKQYNVCLNTFLETSNKYANEKGKLEELIKKSQDDSQECEKRAVKAEVSVLQNWKEAEVWKLQGNIAKAEGNLRVLKALSSSSASAAPGLKAQIDSWETFISNVKKQLEKVEAEYEEKMELVRNGARNCLSKVEIVDVPWPQGVSTIPGRPPISDPAIVTYSSAPHPGSLPSFSSCDGKAPAQPSLQAQTGAKPAPATSEASSASGKTHPRAPEGPHSNKPSPSQPAGISASNSQHVQPKQTHQDTSALQVRPSGIPNSKKLPKALEKIIAQLQSIFPKYSSADFSGFIRDVQRRNGNSLSADEILSHVTELILEQQRKAAPPAGRAVHSPGAARGRAVPAEGITSGLPRAGPAPKTSSSKNPNLPPWGNAGATPKTKWKKQDNAASSEDPCTICQDELSTDCCELECGHHFHRECIRTWLKQHSSTCPICRVHALLPEDFPELPAWNKYS